MGTPLLKAMLSMPPFPATRAIMPFQFAGFAAQGAHPGGDAEIDVCSRWIGKAEHIVDRIAIGIGELFDIKRASAVVYVPPLITTGLALKLTINCIRQTPLGVAMP